jgi:hypothetical protein
LVGEGPEVAVRVKPEDLFSGYSLWRPEGRVDLKEFKERGYLLEVNRRVLHPVGVGLTLWEDASKRVLAGFVDSRSDREGLMFPSVERLDRAVEKVVNVQVETLEKRHARESLWGTAVQPIPGCLDSEPVTLSADDATVDFCLRLAIEAASEIAELDAEEEAVFVGAVLLRVIGPLIAHLRLLPGGLLAYLDEAPKPKNAGLNSAQMGRARYLARELIRLSGRHAVSGGLDVADVPVQREADTELLATEVEEARALAIQVQSWELTRAPADGRYVLDRMEALFSLAQPGMRFWRGERPDLIAAADSIHARLDAYRAKRTELERFLAGELAAHELADPEAVRAALEERAAPLREALAAIEAERASAAGALAPVVEALSRLSRGA